MITIGIDGNEANVEKRVGIGEHSFQLLSEFEKLNPQNIDFLIYLKEKPLVHMPKERKGWKYKIVKPRKFWTQLGLPLSLFMSLRKPNIFFTPSHYAPRFSPVPTAITIHDLGYIHYPELFAKKDLYQLVNWTKYSAQKAKVIFTVSNSTRNDIIKEYKVEPEKVIVTYSGIKPKMETSKNKTIEGKYILFVGTLQPRKNISKLVEAFSKVKDKDIKLVIAGKKGWLYEDILQSPKKFDVEDRVKFLDFVSDEELVSLYENALCFVLPSLYEGFGLPVLEAMKYGCPVITSNVSSLPEAGGDAALYFDPNDAEDIARTIEKVVGDEGLRKEMSKKGLERVKQFSWEKTAKETLEVLQELGKSS